MRDSAQNLSAIRKQLIEDRSLREAAVPETFQSGHLPLDAYLDGGFQRGQLHEIFADGTDNNGSAAGFAAMLSLRALHKRTQKGPQTGDTALWLRTIDATHKGGRFSPSGFAELGGDPSSLLMAVAPDDTALLRCAADALRCHDFGVVIAECWGTPSTLNLTASRRLTLAANHTGVTAIMLRLGAQQQPSTASTRWLVRSAISNPLEANAPGHPTFDLTLLRRRSGASGKSWRVEWNRDARSFREAARYVQPARSRQRAPVLGAMVSLPAGKQAEYRRRIKQSA